MGKYFPSFCKMAVKNWRLVIDEAVSSINRSTGAESEYVSIVH